MPRRQLEAEAPPDDIALARSTLNKDFHEYIDIYGDPRIKLLALAAKAEEEGDIGTAVRALSTVAEYIAPKLRSMEVKAEVQSTSVVFNIDLGDEDESEVVDAAD